MQLASQHPFTLSTGGTRPRGPQSLTTGFPMRPATSTHEHMGNNINNHFYSGPMLDFGIPAFQSSANQAPYTTGLPSRPANNNSIFNYPGGVSTLQPPNNLSFPAFSDDIYQIFHSMGPYSPNHSNPNPSTEEHPNVPTDIYHGYPVPNATNVHHPNANPNPNLNSNSDANPNARVSASMNINVNVDSTTAMATASPQSSVTSLGPITPISSVTTLTATLNAKSASVQVGVNRSEDAPVKVIKTAPGEWKCTEPGCDRVFHRNDRARAHDRLHAGIYGFRCDDKCGRDNCGSVFTSEELLRAHCDKTRATCTACGINTLKKNAARHRRECHGQDNSD